MRCIICESFSLKTVCTSCQNTLKPKLHERKIDNGFSIYSFFSYESIAPLLHTKHKPVGRKVYATLAKLSFKKFLKSYHEDISLIPIDDKPKGGYSHTAVLASTCKSKNLTPLYNCLRATNPVSYSGKSLSFRKKNPRKFTCNIKTKKPIILIDDLVTTGTTLLEAKKVLEKSNLTPLFALVLADAKVK